MKKIIAILLTLILLLGISVFSVSASEATDIEACREKADPADSPFGGLSIEYVVLYVGWNFVNEEDEIFNKDTMTHPYNGDTINQFLSENFVLSDAMFLQVQSSLGYDAATNIYNIPSPGGYGGYYTEREYVSYVKNPNRTYSLYYQTIDWLELPDSEYEKIEESNDYPDSVEYNGKVYECCGGYYLYKNGYKDGGLMHTFDIKNGVARFISTEEYTGNKVPVATKPSDKEESKPAEKEESKPVSKPETTDNTTGETDNNTSSQTKETFQTVTETDG